MVEWYRDCLGMIPEGTDSECKSFYATFEYRDIENPEIKRTIAWAIMPADQDITDKPRTGRFNYTVKKHGGNSISSPVEGVTSDKAEDYETYGKFAWVTDPDGNKIELGSPSKKANRKP